MESTKTQSNSQVLMVSTLQISSETTLEMTHLHRFSFLFKTNYFSLLPADDKTWELELTVTKVILQLEKWKDGKNLALQKVNKTSWGLKIVFGVFYFLEGFSSGECTSGHCFYGLCKHHCLMSSPSCSLAHFTFPFTTNIYYKEQQKLSYRIRALQSSPLLSCLWHSFKTSDLDQSSKQSVVGSHGII